MTWVMSLLIGLGIFLFGIICLVIYLIWKVGQKNKVRINIILKNKRIHRFKIKSEKLSEQIKYKDAYYIFDDEALIKGVIVDDIFFYENNPQPILFDFKANIPGTKAKDLQSFLDTDLIEKLFQEKLFETMKLLLIIILIVTALILIVSVFSVLKKDVMLSPENYEFLYNVTTNAIRGI